MVRLTLAIEACLLAGASATCTFEGGCPWDKLSFSCSTPALNVLYSDVKHYTGVVSCGNLFLEQDIGGGINTPPLVWWPQADSAQTYALLMIDPDCDMVCSLSHGVGIKACCNLLSPYLLLVFLLENVTGSYPDTSAAGPHAPVRHWVVGNIPGSDLQKPSPLACPTCSTVSPFHGPSPSSFSH
eukprot:gene8097-7464_t